MKLTSFTRLFGEGWQGGTKNKRRRRPADPSRARSPRLTVEALETRDLMAVIPAANVIARDAFEFFGTSPAGFAPSVSINPLNRDQLVAVWGVGGPANAGPAQGMFSSDGGLNWGPFGIPGRMGDLTTQNVDPFTQVTDVTVAWDRMNRFFVLQSQHNDDNTSGVLLVSQFVVDAIGPRIMALAGENQLNPQGKLLSRWAGGDPVLNPVIVVDTNLPTFTDPETGAVQTDPNSNTIYVAFNTDNTPASQRPNSPFDFNNRLFGTFNRNAVKLLASRDGGNNFTGEQYVNDGAGDPNYGSFALPTADAPLERDSFPQLVITQGSADGDVTGGRLIVTWHDFGRNRIQVDSSQTVGSGAAAGVFTGGPLGILDALPAPQGANADVPRPTLVPVTVNITDTNFTTLADLDVNLGLIHPNLSQLLIELVAPNGQAVILVNNRINAAGQDRGIGIQGADLGFIDVGQSKRFIGLTLDQSAGRPIFDPGVMDNFVNRLRPETGSLNVGGLNAFNGLTREQVNGTWMLRVTDFRNDGQTPPPQSVTNLELRFASLIDTNTFATDVTAVFGQPNPARPRPLADPTRGNLAAPFPNGGQPVGGAAGFGAAPVLAADNTLGSFSPNQGRVYLAWSGFAGGTADNSDIFLLVSDDGGQSFFDPTNPFSPGRRVNDDSALDGFSEGTRPQFAAQLAVDQLTGTLVTVFRDVRQDASRARSAMFITTTIDGGLTFSRQVFLNEPKTATEVITNTLVTLEPIPDNQTAAGPLGFGDRQGVVVSGGNVFVVWAGNHNQTVNRQLLPGSSILTAKATIAGGPRLTNGDQGPVTADFVANGVVYNNTFAADGTRRLEAFVVEFDRPVDPRTFGADDVTVVFRDTVTPAGTPGTLLDVAAVTPLDGNVLFGAAAVGGNNALATRFLVRLANPQSAVGTYSYSISGNIRDRIRPPGSSAAQSVVPLNPVPPPFNQPFVSTDVPKSFGDPPLPQTNTSTIVVPNLPTGTVIADVNVTVNINHTFTADIQMALIAPDGTRVQLFRFNGDNNDNLINTTFDDQAAVSIAQGSPPFTGSFRPVEPLSRLIGRQAGGIWTLELTDNIPTDQGTLTGWSLSITPGVTPLTTGNILISTSEGPAVLEFSRTGQLVRTLNVATERDLVFDSNGNVQLYNGTFNPVLTTLNGATGQVLANTGFPGWSTVNNITYGGLAAFGNFVFATDMATAPPGGPAGIIRFNVNNLSDVVRFGIGEPIDLNVGLDGLLYALASGGINGGATGVQVYDPVTMQLLRTFSLADEVRAIAVDANGFVFGAQRDSLSGPLSRIVRYDSNGNRLNFVLSPIAGHTDIDITRDGQTLLVSSHGGAVVLVNSNLDPASFVTFTTRPSNNTSFAAFVQPPVGAAGGMPPSMVFAGNLLDQNANGVGGELSDTFTLPNPLNGTPFLLPFETTTLPLIIPGPHLEPARTFSAAVPAGGLTIPTSGTGGSATPADNVREVTLTVSGIQPGRAVTDLNVLVDIDHPRVSDLVLTLIGPDGTSVVLSNRNPRDPFTGQPLDQGVDFNRVVFDDQATQLLTQQQPSPANAAVFAGPLRPENPLTKFNSLNPNGTWTLRIEDLRAGPEPMTSLGRVLDFKLFVESDLVLNAGTNALDLVFDRDVTVSTFTAADVLRVVGPLGQITGPFTITPMVNDAPAPTATVARVFRLGLPTQSLNGTYTVQLSSDIMSTSGFRLDTNLNAGLDVLRGGDPATGQLQDITYNSANVPVTLTPGRNVVSLVNVPDNFLIQGAKLQLNILHPNTPDLEAVLETPDQSKSVKLFTRVGGNASPPRANFINTSFDDAAPTPIQLGFPPFNLGPYNPQTPLSDLKGGNSGGNWRLVIRNNSPNLAGTLTSWSLTLTRATPGTGLGEPVADQVSAGFRVFTMEPSNSLARTQWTAVGPPGISAANGQRASAGRVGGVSVDPSDPSGNTVYVAGASGGVWKTTNFLTTDPNGPTYVALTDFGPTFSLNIGSMTVAGRNNDPNQSIIFAATGEGDTAQLMAQQGGPELPNLTAMGVGFLRSMDGGLTWVLLDSSNNVDAAGNILPINSPLRDRMFVNTTAFKVIADPKPSTTGDVILYAALSSPDPLKAGIWRSTTSGRTWERVFSGQATDVTLAAGSAGSDGNLQVLYAAFRDSAISPERGGGVYVSPNRGASWQQLIGNEGNGLRVDNDPFLPNGQLNPNFRNPVPVSNAADTPNGAKGRISLATPARTGNPLQDLIYQGWVYALVASADGQTDGLYLTKDFGRNWTKVRLPTLRFAQPVGEPTAAFPSNDETRADHNVLGPRREGNYAQSISIDPLNPNIVYVGGSGRGVDSPASHLIRVDTTALGDAHALVPYDNSDNDGGLLMPVTTGGISIQQPPMGFGIPVGLYDRTLVPPPPPFFETPFLNLLRDPANPFVANATLFLSNSARFNNFGDDIRFAPFIDVLASGNVRSDLDASALHEAVAIRDPLTGRTRLIFGTDNGVFSAVDRGDGTLITEIGMAQSATAVSTGATLTSVAGAPSVRNFSRNGNLQITQFYQGALQPSLLAGEIAGALFYGMAQDNGFPASDPLLLRNGNLVWTGPRGDGTGVGTDPGGTGNVYQYRWPGLFSPATEDKNGIRNEVPSQDFFGVIPAGALYTGRTTGLIRGNDNPFTGTGQYPNNNGSIIAVNNVNGRAVVMSPRRPGAQAANIGGQVYRTIDGGLNWFVIRRNDDVDGQAYATALAFGAPPPAAPTGNLDNFVYAGTENGRIFVTFTGGGSQPNSNAWKEITGPIGMAGGLDGTQIMDIITNPNRGSREVYAVTRRGVYFMADSGAANPQWVNITSNLFSIQANFFNDPRFRDTVLERDNGIANQIGGGGLMALAIDFRFQDVPGGSRPPVLYVGGEGGVFRSTDRGASWHLFPRMIDGAPREGGLLPNVIVTDLDIAQGNIDVNTGRPDLSGGPNVLLATTYGRGAFAIRLESDLGNNNPNTFGAAGPRVVSVRPTNPGNGAIDRVDIVFDGPVEPTSFTLSDIISFTAADGTVITPLTLVDVTPPPAPLQPNLHNQYRITFAPVNKPGVFKIVIGPNVTDFSGNRLDQNQNGVNADGRDVYTGFFFRNTGPNGPDVPGIVGRELETGRIQVLTSTGSTFTNTTFEAFPANRPFIHVVTGDFNGDGKTDQSLRDPTTGNVFVGINNGTSFTFTQWGNLSTAGPFTDVRVGDYNGDGLDDIAQRFVNGAVFVSVSTGTQFVTTFWNQWAAIAWQDTLVGDFNGDGRDDLYARTPGGANFVAVSDGSRFTQIFYSQWAAIPWQDTIAADFNNDGRDDVVSRTPGGAVFMAFSTATGMAPGFAQQVFFDQWAGISWQNTVVGDFNGDGFLDLASRVPGSGNIFVAESVVEGGVRRFRQRFYVSWAPIDNTWANVVAGDFNGDGRTDLAHRSAQSGGWFVSVSVVNAMGVSSFQQQNWLAVFAPNRTFADVQGLKKS